MTKIDRVGLAILVFGGAVVMSGAGGVYFGAPFERPVTTKTQPSTLDDVAGIADWNWELQPDFGTRGAVKWNVLVLNKSARNLKGVKVQFVTYDEAGALVSSDYTYVMTVPAGQTRAGLSHADLYGTEASATVEITEVYYAN
jgi:hypothetical protein